MWYISTMLSWSWSTSKGASSVVKVWDLTLTLSMCSLGEIAGSELCGRNRRISDWVLSTLFTSCLHCDFDIMFAATLQKTGCLYKYQYSIYCNGHIPRITPTEPYWEKVTLGVIPHSFLVHFHHVRTRVSDMLLSGSILGHQPAPKTWHRDF